MKDQNFTKLGFLESEKRVYLALLERGQSSVTKISKEAGLNRVSVYKALHNLTLKGLVAYVIKANNKEYLANSPKVIERLILEKEEEIKELRKEIPDLFNLFNSTKKQFEANIYEGIKGAKAIWENLLEEAKAKDEWLVLGAPKSAEIFGGYFKEFNKKRANKKIKMRIIYNKDAVDLINTRKMQPLTEVRVMPKEYITPTSLEVIGDNALLVIYEPQIMIFHIKNKETSESFKAYFNMLWKIARK